MFFKGGWGWVAVFRRVGVGGRICGFFSRLRLILGFFRNIGGFIVWLFKVVRVRKRDFLNYLGKRRGGRWGRGF